MTKIITSVKVSDLIKTLTFIEKKHGNLNVFLEHWDYLERKGDSLPLEEIGVVSDAYGNHVSLSNHDDEISELYPNPDYDPEYDL